MKCNCHKVPPVRQGDDTFPSDWKILSTSRYRCFIEINRIFIPELNYFVLHMTTHWSWMVVEPTEIISMKCVFLTRIHFVFITSFSFWNLKYKCGNEKKTLLIPHKARGKHESSQAFIIFSNSTQIIHKRNLKAVTLTFIYQPLHLTPINITAKVMTCFTDLKLILLLLIFITYYGGLMKVYYISTRDNSHSLPSGRYWGW